VGQNGGGGGGVAAKSSATEREETSTYALSRNGVGVGWGVRGGRCLLRRRHAFWSVLYDAVYDIADAADD